MSSVIISVRQKQNSYLSCRCLQNTALTVKIVATDINQSFTYRANTNHFIAFKINENIGDNFQVPYPLIF